MKPSPEIWKHIPGTDGYEASSLGRIRSYRDGGYRRMGRRRTEGRVLVPAPNPRGYLRLLIYGPGGRKSQFVARLVALAFLGQPPPDKPMALHKDGRPSNNAAENIYWGDDKDNAADALRHGTFTQGERHPRAKLTKNAVLEIIKLRTGGLTEQAIADRFGVRQNTVSRVLLGVCWGHTTGIKRRPHG